MKSTAVILMLF